MTTVNYRRLLVNILLYMNIVQISLQTVRNLAQGRITGVSQDGYVSYVGIPYASVNGNVGRFKGAGLAPVWSGVRESRDPHCSSMSEVEACLQLDVHVPGSGSQMPVLVWVKGGSGNYHPGKLVAQGIIVVVVRHRLGALGFLCSKGDKIPGNAGIKDVLQALRWVRDNIVAFNGNPHKVVLGGQSFGAAMVEGLMLLSSSRELFHGVILQSGSILCPWTFNYDAEDRANALRKMLNDTDVTVPSILKTDTITLETKAEAIDFPYMPFGICVEKPYKNEEGVILETPYTLLLKGKTRAVPLLMGYNTNEAYIFVSMLKDANIAPKMSKDMTVLLPEEFQNLSERTLLQMTKQINDLYFVNKTMAAVLSYHRDAYFLSHIHQSLRFHAKMHQPVYYYQFSYSSNIGVQPEPGLRKFGAAHSDELAYLFPQNGRDLEDDDGAVQQHLIRLWSNFVKHLNPTPEMNSQIRWEPTGPDHPRVLDINTELEMKEFPHTQNVQIWENIYDKYYYTKK
ncbi:esterase FE4-like [Epargyreus clarus]|uniref:esterase FE4-like n=1 Tax=Epargyreus clarus TaxID=520877 RepID=UPI003C2C142E